MAYSLDDTEKQELKLQLQEYIERDIKLGKQRRKRSRAVGALRRRCRELEEDRQAILRENHLKANLLRDRDKRITELRIQTEQTWAQTQSNLIRRQQKSDITAERIRSLQDQLAQKGTEVENLNCRLGSCETELGRAHTEQVTLLQMLDKSRDDAASLQTEVEATKQQLRLKDREHDELNEELTAYKKDLAKCKARLEDFEVWDIGDMDFGLLAKGIQPSAFKAE